MEKDILTEWSYGKDAVRVIGKLLLIEQRDNSTFIGGIVLPELVSTTEIPKDRDLCTKSSDEMWEVEMIIIPKRKYMHNKEDAGWFGLRIDQKLLSDWGHRESWNKRIK